MIDFWGLKYRRRTLACSFKLFCFVVFCLLTQLSSADWPAHRGNQQRTGFHEQRINSSEWIPSWVSSGVGAPSPAWPAPARGSLWQRLTSIEARVTDDRGDVPLLVRDQNGDMHLLIASSASDQLISLDAQNGIPNWQFIADAPIRYAPAIHNGRAWFGADDGMLRAINIQTGELLWEKHIGPELPKIIGNGRLISSHPIRTSVLFDGHHVYTNAGLFPSQGVYSVALEAESGKLKWRRKTNRSPQGYLLSDAENRLYIPCGRAQPFSVALDTGQYIGDSPSPGGSFCMLTEDAFFSGPGNSAVIQSYPTAKKTKMLPVRGRSIVAGANFLWTADGENLRCYNLQKKLLRQHDAEVWVRESKLQRTMIVSGDVSRRLLFVAEGNRVEVYDATSGAKVAGLTIPDTAEQIQYLAVSGSNQVDESEFLVATTSSGKIFSWRGVSRNTPKADEFKVVTSKVVESIVNEDSNTFQESHNETVARVKDVLSKQVCKVGLALLVADTSGVATDEILKTSQFDVVSVVSDKSTRDQLRKWFVSQNVYGDRVTVLAISDGNPFPFAERIFNFAIEVEKSGRGKSEFYQMIDSGTGVLALHGQPLEVSKPIDGGGRWRHQYGTPSNTADSEDELVGAAKDFRLQWFGGVGPSRMPDRHLRGQAPLASGSVMVLHGDECLIGVDPSNGYERWHLDLPAEAMRYVTPYDAAYSCLSKNGDVLYTTTAKEIWKLNAYTGERISELVLPEGSEKLRWGYLSEMDGDLFVTSMKPTAARLRGPTQLDDQTIAEQIENSRARRRGEFDRATMRREYTSEDYNSVRPLVCSRILHRYENASNRIWSYTSRGVIPNGSISLSESGERIVFIEGFSEACVKHESDRVSVPTIIEKAEVVCLNAKTGQEIWKQPFGLKSARNMLFTQVVDDSVVLSTSESKSNGAYYYLKVLKLSNGETEWTREHAHIRGGLTHGEQVHHPLALRQESGQIWLLAEPYFYDLKSGEKLAPKGESADWALRRPGHSCGTVSGAGACIFFRATNPTVLNLSDSEGVSYEKLSPSRPGCWINMIPSSGRLLIPEGSASCVCQFPLQTSFGFVPVPATQPPIPVLKDVPQLDELPLEKLYSWNFDNRVNGESKLLSSAGNLKLQSAVPLQVSEDGVQFDGKQWLAWKLDEAAMPSLPMTITLEATVKVADGTPDWSGLVGALQDNGSYERGCLLGIHKGKFFLAIASQSRARLTYLEAPEKFSYDKECHVLGTYDGKKMSLYLQGELVAESGEQSGAVLYDRNSWFTIGTYKDNNEHYPLHGTIKNAAVFQGVITPDEVLKRAETQE